MTKSMMTIRVSNTLALAALLAVSLGSQARDLERKEWYVRLIISADTSSLKDPGNVLGQLEDALTGADRYDVQELAPPFPGRYLNLVFHHPEWALDIVDYTSDYHPLEHNKGDQWAFEVRSDDPYRGLTLSWEGLQANLKKMVLVDLATGEVISASARNYYRFNMDGANVRAFEWQYLGSQERGKAVGKNGGKTNARKSDWQPYGWTNGNGKGKGHAQLPENPLSD
ncbi:hypothetical protein ACFL3Y_01890 [Pseudomonadota bacterium]